MNTSRVKYSIKRYECMLYRNGLSLSEGGRVDRKRDTECLQIIFSWGLEEPIRN